MSAKPRVLVVDDQESLRSLLSRLLAREGFDPIEAADGAQAIELFRSQAPLVVVSDIMMPRMDGLALLTEVKRIDPNAVVILMTGQGNEDILLHALRGGATNFFKKPFNVRELIEEIRKIVDFRIEAARSTLFSPFLVGEIEVIRDTARGFALLSHHQPGHPPAAEHHAGRADHQPEDRDRGDDHQRAGARQPGHHVPGKEHGVEDGTLQGLLAERGRASDAAGKKIHITSVLSTESFEITIRDEGEGFDWRALPDVAPENLMSFNGRGIFLTKIYFDEVIYSEKGTQVTLRKRRK